MSAPVDRHAQIITLLRSRDDHLPTQARRDHPPAGFIHNTVVRQTCADCLSNDRILKTCETCHGRGYIEVARERDPYAVEKVQPYGMTGDRHEQRRERDSEIARMEAQTREPWSSEQDALADANRHPEMWELERARKWRDFDYAALDVALERLRQVDVEAYRAIMTTYVYGRGIPETEGVA